MKEGNFLQILHLKERGAGAKVPTQNRNFSFLCPEAAGQMVWRIIININDEDMNTNIAITFHKSQEQDSL